MVGKYDRNSICVRKVLVSMKKNRMIVCEKIELDNLAEGVKRVIIDGNKIDSMNSFFRIMAEEFQLPDDCEGNIPGFLDWMRDLGNINCDKIELIIKNQKHFIEFDPQVREKMLSLFREYILPYWEEEVLLYCVGGETKEFIVYLVDDIRFSNNE